MREKEKNGCEIENVREIQKRMKERERKREGKYQ